MFNRLPGREDPAEAGALCFAFERIEQTPNTLDAHRLTGLADVEGLQEAVVETLFKANFAEGRGLGHAPALLDMAVGGRLRRGEAD